MNSSSIKMLMATIDGLGLGLIPATAGLYAYTGSPEAIPDAKRNPRNRNAVIAGFPATRCGGVC
jgi:hypothetical protein